MRTFLFHWLRRRPQLLRALLALGRRLCPRLRIGGSLLLLGQADVIEVMSRDQDFTLAELGEPRMVSGPFLLGMDASPQYARQKERLTEVSYDVAGFLDRVAATARATAQARVADARARGEIDVVSGLAEPVTGAVVVQEVLGTRSVELPELVHHLRQLAILIVAVDARDRRVRARAEEARRFLAAHLCASREAKRVDPDSMLGRLIGAKVPDADADAAIAGICATATATVVHAVGAAVDQLLDAPDVLAAAADAVARGDDALLDRIVFEALRFNPMLPFVARCCIRATRLGDQDLRAGTHLSISLLSAMFDAEAVPDPERFRTDRPLDSYLHFGHGFHHCFGRPLAEVELPAIMKALLAGGAIRRATGRRGRLRYDGPAISGLLVQL